MILGMSYGLDGLEYELWPEWLGVNMSYGLNGLGYELWSGSGPHASESFRVICSRAALENSRA